MSRGKQLSNRLRNRKAEREFIHSVEKEATRIAKERPVVYALYQRMTKAERELNAVKTAYAMKLHEEYHAVYPTCLSVMRKIEQTKGADNVAVA